MHKHLKAHICLLYGDYMASASADSGQGPQTLRIFLTAVVRRQRLKELATRGERDPAGSPKCGLACEMALGLTERPYGCSALQEVRRDHPGGVGDGGGRPRRSSSTQGICVEVSSQGIWKAP